MFILVFTAWLASGAQGRGRARGLSNPHRPRQDPPEEFPTSHLPPLSRDCSSCNETCTALPTFHFEGFPRAGRPRSTDAPRSVSAGETLPSKALQGRCPTLKAISFLASKEPQASVGGHVSVSGCTPMSAPTFSQNINENIRTQVGGSIMELTSIATHLTYLPFSLISGILFYYHSH
ncbi:uncharacterized protein [Penaeus vannamei]|uniref:uncharacterized protein isoform X1 n=1 Tax=Penaeus vannamei TaxID=6689 RepID=UPI00387F4A9E